MWPLRFHNGVPLHRAVNIRDGTNRVMIFGKSKSFYLGQNKNHFDVFNSYYHVFNSEVNFL